MYDWFFPPWLLEWTGLKEVIKHILGGSRDLLSTRIQPNALC